MAKKRDLCFLLLFVVFFTFGCSFLLPSSKQVVKSPWETFAGAKDAFDKILPNQTTKADLEKEGFDPFASPNVRVLTYLEIIQRFSPNPSFNKDDLDEELVDCLSVKKNCRAYELTLQRIKRKRYGNFLLDMLRFKRSTRKSGWEFSAFIVLKNGVVVYKLWSGKPNVDEDEQKVNPLGVLQDPAGMIPNVEAAF
jgi:hypothetical protein